MKRKDISSSPASYYWILAILLLGVLSCESLDKYPLDSLSTGTFWQTENDAMMGLTGVYRVAGGTSQANWDFWNQLAVLYLFE